MDLFEEAAMVAPVLGGSFVRCVTWNPHVDELKKEIGLVRE